MWWALSGAAVRQAPALGFLSLECLWTSFLTCKRSPLIFPSSLLKKGALGFSTHLQRTNQHSGSSSPQPKLRTWKPKSPLTTAGPPPHSCGQAQVSTPHPWAGLALAWRFTSPTDTETLVSVYQNSSVYISELLKGRDVACHVHHAAVLCYTPKVSMVSYCTGPLDVISRNSKHGASKARHNAWQQIPQQKCVL